MKFGNYLKIENRKLKIIKVIIGLLIFGVFIAATFYLLSRPVQAAWFDETFTYRQKITVTNNGSAQTNYIIQALLDTATLITAGKMQSDCDDIRFTDVSGKLLPHWLDGPCNLSNTSFFVKTDSVIASTSELYVYYGNPSAASVRVFTSSPTGINTGNGVDGTCTVSANTNINTGTCVGRANGDAVNFSVTQNTLSGQNQITVSTTPTGLAANDEILIINLMGTSSDNSNVGKYETVRITGIASNTLTLDRNLTNAYDGTTQKIMVQRVPNYTSVTVNVSTSWTPTAWDGSKSGIVFFRATGTVTVNGSISATGKGYNYGAGGSGGGFYTGQYDDTYGRAGQGPSGTGGSYAGGGATTITTGGENCNSESNAGAGGVGGGYSSTGTTGGSEYCSTTGSAGPSYGSASLPQLYFGGGGSGGAGPTGYGGSGGGGGNGGVGGGIVGINAATLTINSGGSVVANGNDGSTGTMGHAWDCFGGGGGGGAGGSVFLNASSVTLGSSLSTATGGGAGASGGPGGVSCKVNDTYSGAGGAGSSGRIATAYSTTSGTTNPSANTTTVPVTGAAASEEKSAGPIAYWKLDDATGTTAQDSTANNYDGTISGATWQTEDQCISGKCLYFDGTSNENVSKSDDALLDFAAADSFTLSAWVKRPGASSANNFILTKAQSGYTGYKLYQDASGDYCFDVSDGTNTDTACTSAVEFDDTQWHLVQGVKSGTTSITLYVDGKQRAQDASIAATGTLANTGTFYAGVDLDGTSNEWSGFIDEVKIYNYARTAAQVKADFAKATSSKGRSASFGTNTKNSDALSNGLVGYWKMDESSWTNDCSTSSVTDSSGNGNNGKACPASTGPTGGASGKFGNAGSFDGTNDYVSIPDNNSLDITQGSVSAWVYVNSYTGSYPRIIDKSGSYDINMYVFGGGEGRLEWDIRIPGETDTVSVLADAVPLTTWTHIVTTYDGSVASVYVNNKLVARRTGLSGSITNSSSALSIGATTNGTAPFPGKIDEVRIYNRALSPVEVSQLYNWAPGPVGYWNFEEGATGTSQDVSGNANSGTDTGTTIVTGKYGNARSFNGTSDKIAVSNTISGVQTYEFWVNPTSTTATLAGLTSGAYISASSGTLSATGFTSPTIYVNGISGGALVANVWQHVAVTTATAIASANAITFGFGNSTYFSGKLDDVRIYNYARTQKQIIEDMNAGHPAGGSPVGSQVAYWKLDAGYGTTAEDSSQNNNDLTLSSASWTNSGKFGKAWNGTGALWLSRADDADFDVTATDDYSVSLWYKSDSATNPSTVEYLFNKASATIAGYAIYANTSGNLCFGIDDDTSWGPDIASCTTTDVYDATWHHVAAIRNTVQDKTYIYVDGVLRDSDTDTTTATLANSLSLYVGDRDGSNGTDEFNGDIDEIKVYRLALTADEIKIDYNRGSAQVLGANSADPSYLVSDTFTRSDGSLSSTETSGPDGKATSSLSWTGSTWTVSGNKAINTPNLGSELVTNGSFETGNPPSNWSQQGTPTTFEQSSTQAQSGTYSLHVISDQNNEGATQSLTLNSSAWYFYTGYIYPVTGTDFYYLDVDTNNDPHLYQTAGQWNFNLGAQLGTQTVLQALNYGGYENYFDNISVKALTTSELFATVSSGKANVVAEVDITIPDAHSHTPTGLILRADSASNPQNFLVAYIIKNAGVNGWGRLRLLKSVNGTYTQLFVTDLYTAGTSYSAGRKLQVALDGATAQVYYDGKLVNTATVTDSSIINNTIHGLFSTYSGNSLDNFTLQSLQKDYTYCVPGDSTSCAAPVGEWNFEEAAGTTANDISGNAVTGTLSTPTYTTGKFGTALSFNGSSDSVTFATTITGVKSVAFWVNPASTTQYFMDLDGGTHYISASSGTVSATGFTSPTIYVNGVSGASITANAWNFIEVTTGTSFNSTTSMTFGKSGSNYLNGKLDQIRIYNYARTAAQVAWDYNNGKPVGHWKFNECQGTTANDSSGNGNTGTITIGASGEDTVGTCSTSSTSWGTGATGKFNSSLSFDGTDDYTEIASNSIFDFTGSMVVSAWINTNTTGTKTIFARSDTSYSTNALPKIIFFGLNNGKAYIYRRTSNGSNDANPSLTGATTINNSAWHHVVFVINSSTASIYIDGNLDASGTVTSTNITFTSNVEAIARFWNGSLGWTGYYDDLIDDVRVYNYALTATQVKDLYNGGAAVRFGPSTGSP